MRLLTNLATHFSLPTIFVPKPVHAQGVDLGDALKLNPDQPVREVFPTLGSLVSTILPNIFMVSGVILFFLIIAGGFMVISSAGNAEKTDKGKQAITGAIIGFVIIFASYWIVQIIEIITGVNILNSTF